MNRTFRFIGRCLLWGAAVAFVAQVVLGAVGLPSAFIVWITARGESVPRNPRYIVVLGGGGIPSETGLIRTYYAAEYGLGVTGATFIVSLPTDGDPEESSVACMRDELVMRGIPYESVVLEHEGRNTHQQAACIRRMLGGEALDEPLLVVTSPSHGRRAVLCFRKEGFTRVGCRPAHSVQHEADPGPAPRIRYGFWASLGMHIRFARELCAMGYYKARGWI
jgi:uncharacterized SAM-binding protein YcdF (DUF218 family)